MDGDYSFAALLSDIGTRFVPAADKPDETIESTANALWLLAAGEPRPVSRAMPPLPELTREQAQLLRTLVARRLGGEPLAYMIGLQEFMGIDFVVAPGALIPRRETELLAAAALDALRQL